MNIECKGYLDGIQAAMENQMNKKLAEMERKHADEMLMLQYTLNDTLVTHYLSEQLQKQKLKEVYVLRLKPMTVMVTCESCTKKGFVASNCPVCGGKGTHKKTYQHWVIKPGKETIEKVDRDKKTGKLRYWTSSCDFYEESILEPGCPRKYFDQAHSEIPYGVHMVHRNLEEAQAECERLNAILKERGVLV